RGLLGEQLGSLEPPEWRDNSLFFLYHGRDRLDRSTTVDFPAELTPCAATAISGAVHLEPRGEHRLPIRVVIRERETSRPGEPMVPSTPQQSSAPASPGAETNPSTPWPGGIARVISDSI